MITGPGVAVRLGWQSAKVALAGAWRTGGETGTERD
jgi:hypothetical protein